MPGPLLCGGTRSRRRGWGWSYLLHPRAVAGAGGVLPDPPRLGLEAVGLVELALVEQAVGVRVLAGQVGADAQVPGRLPGDHGVLVITDDRWDLLHLPGEPAGGLAAGRAGRLG